MRSAMRRPYHASDPELIEWVHLAFTDSFLTCHEIWETEIPGGPDAYVREWATAGALIGLSDPPVTAAEMRGRLRAVADAGILKTDDRVLDVVRFIRNPPLAKGMMPAYRIMFAGAVGSLDPVHRRMLGLSRPTFLAVPATGAVLRIGEVAARRALDIGGGGAGPHRAPATRGRGRCGIRAARGLSQIARTRLLRASWVSSTRPSASRSGGRYMPKRPR